MLKLDHLSKDFDGIHAVSEVTLDLSPGQVTGLIGPNGAGKTTVTNLITGLMSVSSGTITLDRLDITHMEPDAIARAGVGRTFQSSRLFSGLSVLDNLMVPLAERAESRVSAWGCMLGLRRAYAQERIWRGQAGELLARFGMEEYAHVDAGALAYGQQRRVEIMRGLALRPSVLLLDEPIAGMSDSEAADLGEIFRELAADGIAILLIEHNVSFVRLVCDHLYVLSHGELLADGPPERVVEQEAVIEAYLGGS